LSILRYDQMVENALRSVVREALGVVASTGLPGAHHFFITFRTDAPGVRIADYLRSRYPREMTIVLQNQFSGLQVREDGFSVTLSFNKVPEALDVPYAAIIAFNDPSVKFALQFRGVEQTKPAHASGAARLPGGRPASAAPSKGAGQSPPRAGDEAKPAEKPAAPGEVISLDAFRKK
jgi:hypothetical protein